MHLIAMEGKKVQAGCRVSHSTVHTTSHSDNFAADMWVARSAALCASSVQDRWCESSPKLEKRRMSQRRVQWEAGCAAHASAQRKRAHSVID